ncbi:tRNA methyltransferase, has a role in tRNA modification [Entomortierella chlamydospora]|uniref:tRNA methyltransferase, has a role in tRNA modification n=1 Tax=Entomortierella chlamydospora TaxID=101097 RepID=A0A9P6N3Z6_9FUNG|nr:tRNA methyltransferase, has a role in tRNA modification [Entomortierella chlamydospora]
MSLKKNPLHIPSPFHVDEPDMTPEQKEQEYVHNVYQAIAPHFSATRYKPWPVVEEFLLTMPPGYIGADVGCGNGKYIGVNPNLFIVGSDRSSNLISICGERGHEAMDFAISIAVIHHFISPERRVAAIEEILRVVRIGGRILIFVWALEQTGKRDFDKNTQDVFVPWAMPKKAEPKRDRTRSQPQSARRRDTDASSSTTDETAVSNSLDQSDQTEASTESQFITHEPTSEPSASASSSSTSAAPATTTTLKDTLESSNPTAAASTEPAAPVYNRYYHLFQKGELEELILRTNKASIVQSGYDRDNWWCILEKTSH